MDPTGWEIQPAGWIYCLSLLFCWLIISLASCRLLCARISKNSADCKSPRYFVSFFSF